MHMAVGPCSKSKYNSRLRLLYHKKNAASIHWVVDGCRCLRSDGAGAVSGCEGGRPVGTHSRHPNHAGARQIVCGKEGVDDRPYPPPSLPRFHAARDDRSCLCLQNSPRRIAGGECGMLMASHPLLAGKRQHLVITAYQRVSRSPESGRVPSPGTVRQLTYSGCSKLCSSTQ